MYFTLMRKGSRLHGAQGQSREIEDTKVGHTAFLCAPLRFLIDVYRSWGSGCSGVSTHGFGFERFFELFEAPSAGLGKELNAEGDGYESDGGE